MINGIKIKMINGIKRINGIKKVNGIIMIKKTKKSLNPPPKPG